MRRSRLALADDERHRAVDGRGPDPDRLSLARPTPDHSTISRTRRRLPAELHERVFTRVLELLAEKGLLQGKTLGIDATTLEANAALRSIVRRDDATC